MQPIIHTENRRAPAVTALLALLVVVAVFVFQQASSIAGGRVADVLDNRAVDPDHAFLWLFVHHTVQLLLALLVMLLLRGRFDFHLKPSLNASGARMLLRFCAGMCVYAVLYYLGGWKLGMLVPFGYESSARNVAGTLAFQLLLSGPAEELLFRALPITLLTAVFRRRPHAWLCIGIAALLFAVAHINWYTDPFRLSFYWYQLGYAFALGVLYGIVYLKRGSILYPMVMHSMSNVIVIGLGYVFYASV